MKVFIFSKKNEFDLVENLAFFLGGRVTSVSLTVTVYTTSCRLTTRADYY